MANNVTLNLKITGDGKEGAAAINQVVDGLKKMGAQTKEVDAAAKSATGFSSFGAGAKDAIKNLVGLAAAALGINRFLQLGTDALQNAEALSGFSQETGVSVEKLSVLQFSARTMGLDLVNLRLGFNQLSNSLREVQQGNVATQQMFAAIGLDWRKLIDLPLDESLLRVGAALNNFTSGATKSTVAQALLGGRATKLIALLQSLGGEGFAKASSEAERLGQIMRETDVRAAEEFNASLVGLQSQASTLSRTFLEGVIPGLVQSVNSMDDLTGSTQGARTVFQTLGEIVGGAVKVIVFGLNEIAKTAGNITFLVTRNVEGVAGAMANVVQGNFKEALNELTTADSEIRAFRKAGEDDSAALWKSLFGKPEDVQGAAKDARDAAIAELNQTVTTLRKAGGKIEPIDVTKLSTDQILSKTKQLGEAIKQTLHLQATDQQAIVKAMSDARIAELDRQLGRVKELTAQFVSAASASFDQGRSTVAQFFAAREQAIREQGNAELTAARVRAVELAKTLAAQEKIRPDGPDAIQARTALRGAENEIQMVQLRTEGQIAQVRAERSAKDIELNNARLDFEKALAEAQGRTLDAALIGIDQQVTELKTKLTQIGITGAQQAAALQQFTDAATGKAKFENLSTAADRLSQAIARNQTQLNQEVSVGLLTQDQALAKQNQFIAAQGTNVEQLTQAFILLRGTVSDPAIVAAIDDQLVKLGDIVVAAQGAKTQLQQMQQGALVAGGRSLLTFLSELSDGTHSVGEAFGDMARSFISAILQMIQQILVLQAITAVAKALGVPVPSGGFQFAAGGAVPGAGTGDSVRAMLTPGEFVLNKQMVRQMGGLVQLERLRLAMRSGAPLRRAGVTHYASGGPVVANAPGGLLDKQTGGIDRDITRVVIEVHPDAVVRQVESGPGSRAVIKALKNNRQSAKEVLGH